MHTAWLLFLCFASVPHGKCQAVWLKLVWGFSDSEVVWLESCGQRQTGGGGLGVARGTFSPEGLLGPDNSVRKTAYPIYAFERTGKGTGLQAAGDSPA